MITDQIRIFREKREKLSDVLRDFGSAELKALDTEVSAILDEIFSHQPRNMGEFRSLMEFFLDLLAFSAGGVDPRIISRIEELIDDAIALVLPKGATEQTASHPIPADWK